MEWMGWDVLVISPWEMTIEKTPKNLDNNSENLRPGYQTDCRVSQNG